VHWQQFSSTRSVIVGPFAEAQGIIFDDDDDDDYFQTKEIAYTLLIGSSTDGVARGAGYARTRAIELHRSEYSDYKALRFLCLLDGDDTMHRQQVAEQTIEYYY
jgi:hypothetical protein